MKQVNINKLDWLSTEVVTDNTSEMVMRSIRYGTPYQVGKRVYCGRPPEYRTVPADPHRGIPERIVKVKRGIPFVRIGVVK